MPRKDIIETALVAAVTQGAHGHNITVAAAGGNETRPCSVALLACIKY